MKKIFTLLVGILTLVLFQQANSQNCQPDLLGTNNITSSSANLVWNSFAGNYVVEGGELGKPSVTFNAGAEIYKAENLLPGTGYYWRVGAICGGSTIYSEAYDTFYTWNVCYEPINVQVTDIGADSVVFSWDPVGNPLEFKIAVAAEPYLKGTVFLKTFPPNVTSYVLKQLTPCTNYKFRMASLCGYERSELTPIIDFTTLGCPAQKTDKVVSIDEAVPIGIHPNPVRDYININLVNKAERIDILDLTGTICLSYDISETAEHSHIIDVSRLSPGVYFIQASNYFTKATKRFIKID